MSLIKVITKLFEPTLEGALSSLNKAVAKLERVSEIAFEDVREHEEAIKQATERADQAARTAERAVRVGEKLKELVA